MKDNPKSVTFIVTWGTSRVMSWNVGWLGLIAAVLLLLLSISIPAGVMVYQQLALSRDGERFRAAEEEYLRLKSQYVARIDYLIVYEERVSIMAGQEEFPGFVEEEVEGGLGGGQGTEAAAPADTAAASRAAFIGERAEIAGADWDRKVDWLRRQFEDLMGYMESTRDRLAATPSITPVQRGWISSRFGRRHSPFTGRTEFHRGLDISHRVGTPIVAPAAGVVSFVGRAPVWGIHIKILHGFKFETFYGHLNQATVKVGQNVERGDIIAYMGSTGRATGPHLHYQVNYDGIAVDPENYMVDLGKSREEGQ